MRADQLSRLPGNAVTVRGLSPELKAQLRVRAAHNDRSMEAEARAILEAALSAPDDETTDLGAFARGLFAPLGGIDLELPPRQVPQLGEAEKAAEEEAKAPAAVALAIPEAAVEEQVTSKPASPRRRRR